jgi:hypothetical protein
MTTKFTQFKHSLQCIWNLHAYQHLRPEINRKQAVCIDTNKVHVNMRNCFHYFRNSRVYEIL